MKILMLFAIASMIAVVVAFIWDKRAELKEWEEAAKLEGKDRLRREMFLTYLPQDPYDAELVNRMVDEEWERRGNRSR